MIKESHKRLKGIDLGDCVLEETFLFGKKNPVSRQSPVYVRHTFRSNLLGNTEEVACSSPLCLLYCVVYICYAIGFDSQALEWTKVTRLMLKLFVQW